MTTLVHKTFKFPAGCNAESITMRETSGIDEQAAAMEADARGERTTIYQELVRLSIVEVDGKKVQQPFMELNGWNSKTRHLINTAYQAMNDLREDDVKVFLKSADAQPDVGAKEASE